MTETLLPVAPQNAVTMADGWDPYPVPPKTTYSAERIQLNDWPPRNFHEDRKEEGKRPLGFHIYGFCSSCRHETSALCAVKYLENDQDLVTATENEDPERLRRKARVGSTTVVTVLRCDCLEPHEGAPANTGGCGTEWLLRVNYVRENAQAEVYLDPVKPDVPLLAPSRRYNQHDTDSFGGRPGHSREVANSSGGTDSSPWRWRCDQWGEHDRGSRYNFENLALCGRSDSPNRQPDHALLQRSGQLGFSWPACG